LDRAYSELGENEFFRWRHQTRLFYQYGRLELALGRMEKALEWAEKVREMAEKTSALKNLVRADNLSGEVYLADAQWETAARYLRAALAGDRKLKDPNLCWEVTGGLGRALVELGERGEATTLYREGLRLADGVASRLTDENLCRVLLASNPIMTLRRDLERLH
jgi:tetratricopeptide (TPR) repeat protein